MQQSWRWFGPDDKIPLSHIRQAGAEGIVTALHHLPPGAVWPREQIAERRKAIEAAGLRWNVVESLPVSEAIRTATGDADEHIRHWITSLGALAAEGITTVCYNFMPALDWVRTDLAARMPSGARALRFDLVDFASFDIFEFRRDGAEKDYPEDIVSAARDRHAQMPKAEMAELSKAILAGLPGSAQSWSLEDFRSQLAAYAQLGEDGLRDNLKSFLTKVVPAAEEFGVNLCCHPDDPPWPLFGMPRIVSTEADLQKLLDIVPSPRNGITFCTGSLGARFDNDLPALVRKFAPHIHFLHLRSVTYEARTVPASFHEAEHLDGTHDMIAVIKAILAEQKRRFDAGQADWRIPMRPDHGQQILDDVAAQTAPGYPAIGRLKGLAELRGVMRALSHVDDVQWMA